MNSTAFRVEGFSDRVEKYERKVFEMGIKAFYFKALFYISGFFCRVLPSGF